MNFEEYISSPDVIQQNQGQGRNAFQGITN